MKTYVRNRVQFCQMAVCKVPFLLQKLVKISSTSMPCSANIYFWLTQERKKKCYCILICLTQPFKVRQHHMLTSVQTPVHVCRSHYTINNTISTPQKQQQNSEYQFYQVSHVEMYRACRTIQYTPEQMSATR